MVEQSAAAAAFTLADLERYWQVFEGCRDQRSCKWTRDGGQTISTGTLRNLRFLPDVDVRDYEVQISGVIEQFMPISEIVELIRARHFFIKGN